MKPIHAILCAAALALAACGQQTAETEAPEAAAPQGLFEQAQAMSEEERLVFATTQLAAYQQANPDSQPVCSAIRGTESRGIIPPNIDPNSAYAPFVGASVVVVQCGELRSMTAMDPAQQWIVAVAPGAASVQVGNCGGAGSVSRCPRNLPLVEIGPTAPAQ